MSQGLRKKYLQSLLLAMRSNEYVLAVTISIEREGHVTRSIADLAAARSYEYDLDPGLGDDDAIFQQNCYDSSHTLNHYPIYYLINSFEYTCVSQSPSLSSEDRSTPQQASADSIPSTNHHSLNFATCLLWATLILRTPTSRLPAVSPSTITKRLLWVAY